MLFDQYLHKHRLHFFPFWLRIIFVATAIFPVCLSPIINSRWPRPIGIIVVPHKSN